VIATEDGLFLERLGERVQIDLVYRFFELFDLENIPESGAILGAARKGAVGITPPPKPELEEKLAMALLHHPALARWWKKELGAERLALLQSVIPQTWVLDPAPLPDHAIIPGLTLDGAPVQGWHQLKGLGQKARRFVIKPSGFSPNAWGSRGVLIGHDMAQDEWDRAVDDAVAAFPQTPHILQPFHKAVSSQVPFLGEGGGVARMRARTRLCPYYFVTGDSAMLGGVLATPCPENKKKIHGMREAVNVPCTALG